MQFQVPQFIDTEDKIVGPLSLKQFAFIGIGGVFSAILYFTVQTWLWVLVSIFIFGFAIALAFVKIQGRPFFNVLLAAFNFYWHPQTYVWQPEHPVVHIKTESIKAESEKSALADILAKSKIKKILTSPAPSRSEATFSPQQAPTDSTHVVPSVVPAPLPAPKVVPEATESAEVHGDASEAAPIMLVSRESASIGSALHRSWELLQTGMPFAKKNSDKQFIDQKMMEHYQIFQKISGDRRAAKRVDYRQSSVTSRGQENS